jgi:hypothetical protein
MKLFLRLAPWALVGALAVAFAACSNEAENNASTTSGGGAGGAGGAGGEGGGPGASSSTASGTGGGGGAPDVILTCPEDSYTFKTGTCDFLNQDCPPNEACVPEPDDNGVYKTKCLPWAGVKQMGSPCVKDEECEAGLFCGFYCSPPCCAVDKKPCPSSCNFEVQFGAVHTGTVCNLAPKCEFFMEDVCKPGAYCRFDASQGVATCAPLTGNVVGDTQDKPCKFLNDCDHMQTCQGPKGAGTCRFSCDIEKQSAEPGKGGCPSGQECIQYEPEIMAYKNLGHCEPAP